MPELDTSLTSHFNAGSIWPERYHLPFPLGLCDGSLGISLRSKSFARQVFGKMMARNACVAKIRVLLADDHKDMLEYVSKFLAADCCDVVATVSNGQAALDAAAQLQPDVAVLDISMPVLNGIQAAKRLQEIAPNVKIVFLTVDKDPETCRAALATGAVGYVLKPRLGADLIPAIKLAREGQRFVSPGCE